MMRHEISHSNVTLCLILYYVIAKPLNAEKFKFYDAPVIR